MRFTGNVSREWLWADLVEPVHQYGLDAAAILAVRTLAWFVLDPLRHALPDINVRFVNDYRTALVTAADADREHLYNLVETLDAPYTSTKADGADIALSLVPLED